MSPEHIKQFLIVYDIDAQLAKVTEFPLSASRKRWTHTPSARSGSGTTRTSRLCLSAPIPSRPSSAPTRATSPPRTKARFSRPPDVDGRP